MSETVLENRNENTENIDQKALELAQDFSYDGFQVVRRELFAHLREPAVVIRRDSVTFNTACIAGLEDAVYIQILVNPEDKRMVVRKCEENDKDALRWCIAKPDKRKSRKMSNKIFSAMLYDMMGWSMDCRYKILGYKITHEGETIYVFDLLETEIFMDTKRKKKAAEGLVMRISTADQVDYATITNPSDSDIWDALVQLPVSYDSLYLTYSEKGSMSFIFVESEDDKYRLEHDTPELGLELTNVARVSQQVARDILIRFSKEHSVILDDHWKQEKVR